MNIGVILFIIAYLITLFCYFFSETSGNHKRRAINKIIMATMFLVFGIIQYFLHYEIFSVHLLLLFAIVFAFLGDVILLYSFTKGGIAFIVSNILFFTYEWVLIANYNVPFSNIWYFIPLFIIMWGTFAYLGLKRFLNFKSKTKAVVNSTAFLFGYYNPSFLTHSCKIPLFFCFNIV